MDTGWLLVVAFPVLSVLAGHVPAPAQTCDQAALAACHKDVLRGTTLIDSLNEGAGDEPETYFICRTLSVSVTTTAHTYKLHYTQPHAHTSYKHNNHTLYKWFCKVNLEHFNFPSSAYTCCRKHCVCATA